MSGASGIDVAVLGAGRFAAAVARVLSAAGANVRVWARTPGALVSPEIAASGDMAEVAGPAALVVFAVPASAIEIVAFRYGEVARGDQIVLTAARGVVEGFRLPHELIRAKTCCRKIGVLGGPLHARELASGHPLSAVLASRFPEVISAIGGMVRGSPVRVHPSKDIVGVQVAGAISNVSAIAAGMAEELGLGDTARGVLLTHGLVEAQRLGLALGAEASTFTGLAGVGDLIPRSVSSTDRHRETGRRLAAGLALDAALDGLDGEVEGVSTANAALAKAKSLGLEVPLISAVVSVFSGSEAAAEALDRVLRIDDLALR